MIPLPPLAEQRRIVARIKELTTKIDEAYSLRQGIANDLPILFSGIYHQVLEGLHCETSSLGIVAEKKTGVAYKAEDFFEEKGVPVVRLKEITTKRITVYLRNPDKYQNVWLQENDIVLAKTSFSTGAICMWPGPKAVLNQNAIMLRAKPGLQQRFLFVWLKDQVSWYLRQRLADPNFYPYIREKDIMTWRVPIPSPDEQERILRYLEIQQAKIDQLERLQAKTSMDLNALRASIVDELLTGRTAPRNRQDQDTL
jgi:type I restriction enzyme S subunit